MKIVNILFFVMIVTLLSPTFSTRSYAQDWYGAVTYQVSSPVGDTKNFIDKTSWRGAGLEFRKVLDYNTSLGFYFGWNVFHLRTSETIDDVEIDGNPGAITGLQERIINSLPIMLSGHKYFGQPERVRPFIGLSAGGFIMTERFDIGLLRLSKDQWQWGGAPEIGVVVPVGYRTKLVLNAKFFYALTGDSVISGSSTNQSYFAIGVGFAM
jgi:outer membrane protein